MVAVELVWGNREHVVVDGVRIHVETAGPVDGPTIACLHGFASGTFTWAGVAAELRDELRVVAWDRPPFGRSDRPRPATGAADPYRLDADLARSAELLDRVATPDRPRVLVGHSAGALLAVQLALAGATRIDGLVLIAPAVDAEPPLTVRAVSRLPGSGLVAASLLRVGARGAAAFLRRSTRHGTPLTDATAAETGRTLRLPGTADALWHLTTTWEPPAVVARLADVGVPAVVIGGIDDRIVSVEQHRTAAEGLGSDLHLLEGAGHAPHEQQPTVVAGLIRDFVGSI
jgi:pimeloyl-ACP methyl ester carboxylesterase